MKKLLPLILFASVSAFTPARVCLAQEFQTPGSEVSVRDLLEGHKRAPKSDTYYLMALSEARKGNIEAAEKAIRTGLQINPRNTRLMNLKGALLTRQGKLTEARTLFLTVLQLDPEDDYANTSLRAVERTLQPARKIQPMISKTPAGQAADAPTAPVLVKPVQTETKILEATYFIEMKAKQQCYHAMALIKRAQEAFAAANPKRKDEFSTTNLAKDGFMTSVPVCPAAGIYGWKNNDVECEKHGSLSALGAEVNNVFGEFNNGMRAKLSRNYLDALRSFEQVVVLYPRWAEAHYQMADTLFRLGETDPAIASLRNCLKHESDNIDAQLLLANLYFKKGQKDAALGILDKVSNAHKGTVYGLAARSIAGSIRSGRNYYEIFPPN